MLSISFVAIVGFKKHAIAAHDRYPNVDCESIIDIYNKNMTLTNVNEENGVKQAWLEKHSAAPEEFFIP